MRKTLLIVIALLLPLSAAAAQERIAKRTVTPSPKADDITPLLQKIQADAKAALDDANTNQDKLAATCYQAIYDVSSARIQAQQAQGAGLIYAFQKLRDITRLNASPIGTSLIVGCAPLVQDAGINMVTFFTQIGAAVLLKGFLVP